MYVNANGFDDREYVWCSRSTINFSDLAGSSDEAKTARKTASKYEVQMFTEDTFSLRNISHQQRHESLGAEGDGSQGWCRINENNVFVCNGTEENMHQGVVMVLPRDVAEVQNEYSGASKVSLLEKLEQYPEMLPYSLLRVISRNAPEAYTDQDRLMKRLFATDKDPLQFNSNALDNKGEVFWIACAKCSGPVVYRPVNMEVHMGDNRDMVRKKYDWGQKYLKERYENAPISEPIPTLETWFGEQSEKQAKKDAKMKELMADKAAADAVKALEEEMEAEIQEATSDVDDYGDGGDDADYDDDAA